jgi:hypothetical protein
MHLMANTWCTRTIVLGRPGNASLWAGPRSSVD